MRNLRFLSVYEPRFDRNDRVRALEFDRNVRVHVPEDMYFPPRLKLLHWDVYPRKCLPRTFNPQYLVELNLQYSELEKLWEGTQPLTNLKTMNLRGSYHLKELPNLSNATNLEGLLLNDCKSLVEIPSSIGNLHKLRWLSMVNCRNLQIVPTHCNLASLVKFYMIGCWKLRKVPDISTNIKTLIIGDTMLEEVHELSRHWSRLECLSVYGTPPYVEKMPEFIKYIHGLKKLYIHNWLKLVALPELPGSLRSLVVRDCVSLDTLSFSFDSPIEYLCFPNCFKLGREARSVITNIALKACLPGRKVPAEFDHRAIGNYLTIRSDFKAFSICLVISCKQKLENYSPDVLCRIRINGCHAEKRVYNGVESIKTEHIFISYFDLLDKGGWLQQDNEISFEFCTTSQDLQIIECGVQILAEAGAAINLDQNTPIVESVWKLGS